MHMKAVLITSILVLVAADLSWACNQLTYADCSGSELRAIQQQQFYARKHQPLSADEYWRDRQYGDRVRSEERAHELEIERIRAETAIEVAKQESRAWRRAGYTFYRPPVVISPRPDPALEVKPQPYLRGAGYANTGMKKVPKAVKKLRPINSTALWPKK